MNEEILNNLFNSKHSFDYDKVESPIEEILLNHIIKFLDKETELMIQYPISTISGNFRADIALKKNERIVIIECDGEEHHTKDRDNWYDEWRDTLILIQRKAHVIYRVKGVDIQNNIYKVFAIIFDFDKNLFDENYTNRVEKYEIDGNRYKKQIHYDYYKEDGDIIPSMTEIKRKELNEHFDRFWLDYVLYSLINPNKNIYELIDEMSDKHFDSKDLIKMLNEQNPELKLQDKNQLLNMNIPIGRS